MTIRMQREMTLRTELNEDDEDDEQSWQGGVQLL